jgi:hypothetical protein
MILEGQQEKSIGVAKVNKYISDDYSALSS